jgi:hypothetical protein
MFSQTTFRTLPSYWVLRTILSALISIGYWFRWLRWVGLGEVLPELRSLQSGLTTLQGWLRSLSSCRMYISFLFPLKLSNNCWPLNLRKSTPSCLPSGMYIYITFHIYINIPYIGYRESSRAFASQLLEGSNPVFRETGKWRDLVRTWAQACLWSVARREGGSIPRNRKHSSYQLVLLYYTRAQVSLICFVIREW